LYVIDEIPTLSGNRMTRRRFMFWLSLGFFTLGERLRLHGVDRLAAATIDSAKPKSAEKARKLPVHWTMAEDDVWRWYEREHFIKGQWWQTGMTAPTHKTTGARKEEREAYLEDQLVPPDVRLAAKEVVPQTVTDKIADPDLQLPTRQRRSRHGRPPSKWLRSLNADEIRIWLKTIECPEAGVEGMTNWTHLTRDHSFDPNKIDGLTDAEQAKLHGAAHFGF
jgi:hypothetical protein